MTHCVKVSLKKDITPKLKINLMYTKTLYAKVYFLTPRKETFLNCLMMEKSSGVAMEPG